MWHFQEKPRILYHNIGVDLFTRAGGAVFSLICCWAKSAVREGCLPPQKLLLLCWTAHVELQWTNGWWFIMVPSNLSNDSHEFFRSSMSWRTLQPNVQPVGKWFVAGFAGRNHWKRINTWQTVRRWGVLLVLHPIFIGIIHIYGLGIHLRIFLFFWAKKCGRGGEKKGGKGRAKKSQIQVCIPSVVHNFRRLNLTWPFCSWPGHVHPTSYMWTSVSTWFFSLAAILSIRFIRRAVQSNDLHMALTKLDLFVA